MLLLVAVFIFVVLVSFLFVLTVLVVFVFTVLFCSLSFKALLEVVLFAVDNKSSDI